MILMLTHKIIPLIPTASTTAVQKEDSRLWRPGTVILWGPEDHNGRCYKLRVTKTGCIITRTKIHVKATMISAEDYLRNEEEKVQVIKNWLGQEGLQLVKTFTNEVNIK